LPELLRYMQRNTAEGTLHRELSDGGETSRAGTCDLLAG
jgi:hypothetical protein